MSKKGISQSSDDGKEKPTTSKSQVSSRRPRLSDEEEEYVARMSKPKPAEQPAAPQKPKTLAVHVVQSGDTLSHMALQYYGSATREKWMQIYEANKEQLGEYPGLIRPGDKLIIPELTDSE